MNKIYEVDFAGNKIRYSFIYPAARRLFKRYIHLSDSEEYDIRSNPGRIETARRMLPADSDDCYVEYRTLIGLTAKELLKYRCCIFHCVSFVYKGYAWLLSAPSGTGKTTQYFNWERMFPDEIRMISGDMPVLKTDELSMITVNPSPWNGKEDIGNQISAPLGGIIYLEQGNHNQFTEMTPKDGLISVYRQFIVKPDTKEQILSLCSIIEAMFRNYPVLKYSNLGNDESTELLRKKIDQIMENRYEI